MRFSQFRGHAAASNQPVLEDAEDRRPARLSHMNHVQAEHGRCDVSAELRVHPAAYTLGRALTRDRQTQNQWQQYLHCKMALDGELKDLLSYSLLL